MSDSFPVTNKRLHRDVDLKARWRRRAISHQLLPTAAVYRYPETYRHSFLLRNRLTRRGERRRSLNSQLFPQP
jgi:hypothetical protein